MAGTISGSTLQKELAKAREILSSIEKDQRYITAEAAVKEDPIGGREKLSDEQQRALDVHARTSKQITSTRQCRSRRMRLASCCWSSVRTGKL